MVRFYLFKLIVSVVIDSCYSDTNSDGTEFVCTMSYRDILDTLIKIIVFYLTFSLLYNQFSGETLLCHYYF